MRFLAIVSIFVTSLAFSSDSKVPRGYWQCSFWGQEWQMVPGPQGPTYELRQTVYASDWQKTKQAAYDQAADDCQYWSDTSCHFSSCRQKSR